MHRIGAAFMLLLVCLAATAARAADTRPNILFIMADDHGYQAMSCYGSKVNQTPNLDRIARDGMRFDRCFVTNSICGPSRAVILTGKYSHLNGYIRNGLTFNGEQQTVAKLLQAAGYQTAMVGKWHLRSEPTGFDYYEILVGQGPYYNPPMRTREGVVKHTGYTTDIITDVALDWLKKKRDAEKPFLLMYQHKAPHRNWQPGPKYLHKYDDEKIPEPETLFDDYSGRGTPAHTQEMTVARHLSPYDLKLVPQRSLNKEQHAVWDKAYGPKNAAFKKANLAGDDLIRWKYQRYAKDYLRCIASVDENVGRVLDYLDDSGLADNTVVFYTSDQGWYLGEHGWFDKRWMYEESFRTPLLVRWPGKIKPGSTTNSLAMNLDFAETFLDIAGADIPKNMQGASLKPIFMGQEPQNWRKSLYYHYYEFPGAHAVQKHYGVRTDRYKLIHFYEVKEWELYDLEKDPHEMKSVYADPQYAQVRATLEQELQRLRKQYQDDGSVISFGAQRAKRVRRRLAASFPGGDAPGKTVVLNGKGAALSISSRQLNPEYKPFCVGAWCKPSEGSGVIAAQGGASLGYSLYLEDGSLCFAMRIGGGLKKIVGPSIHLNQWVHVAAVLNAQGEAQIYINGQAVAEPLATGFLTGVPSDSFNIGADAGSLVSDYKTPLPFHGELRDARLYWGPVDQKLLARWSQL